VQDVDVGESEGRPGQDTPQVCGLDAFE